MLLLHFPGVSYASHYIIPKIPDTTTLNAVALSTLAGTARKRSLGNMMFLSSSLEQEPRIRLPPEEKGEMAELWAPTTMQV